MEFEERISELREVKSRVMLGGGKDKIEKIHQKGKLTARERIDCLLDPGSFVEWGMLVGHAEGTPGDGIVAGYGTVDGRVVCIYSQDPTVLGGSIGALHGFKMYHTVERALDMRVPFIGLHDSPGARTARPEEGGGALEGISSEKHGGSIFFPNTQASGVIPQISAILGSCAGISVYSPALTDFIFMVDGISQMFITGPRMVKSVMGEEVTLEELDGAKIHARTSGVADFRVKSEGECFEKIKKLLSFLPNNTDEMPPMVETPALEGDKPLPYAFTEIVPCDPNKSYDMHKVITLIVDNGDFLEVKAEFAPEILVGFARLAGCTVGIVANQPMVRAGALTIDSSNKQARFMRFCDCFNIPIILLVDTPAYMPGTHQEHGGIIRHGAKVLYALCEATVPRIVIVLRKAYGGGNLGMGVVPGLATDFVYSWPIAEAGVLGAEQSVELFYVKEIAEAKDPVTFRAEKVKEYREKHANPIFHASRNPYMEDVIEPEETRGILIKTLQALRNKKVRRQPKKHGNIPL